MAVLSAELRAVLSVLSRAPSYAVQCTPSAVPRVFFELHQVVSIFKLAKNLIGHVSKIDLQVLQKLVVDSLCHFDL